MNMTDLRRRALSMLEQRGEMWAQDLTNELAPREHSQWTSQGAVRWAGGYMKPLIDAGYVRHSAGGRNRNDSIGNYYSITEDGRKAIRV